MNFYNNLGELKRNLPNMDDNEQVWRGEDGSYAVGDTFPIEAEEGEVDYTEAGKVSEWR